MSQTAFVRSLEFDEKALVAIIGRDVALNEVANVDRVLPTTRAKPAHSLMESVASLQSAGGETAGRWFGSCFGELLRTS